MKKLLIYSFLFFFICLVLPIYAADPQLEQSAPSAAGSLKKEGGGYSLHDLMGQPIGGNTSSAKGADGSSYGAESGGISGLAAATEKLEPGLGGVSGTVVNEATGNPLPGAKITIYTEQAVLKTALTDNGGIYQALNFSPGVYFIEASKDGFIASYHTVNLEADIITPVDFSLAPGKAAPIGTVGLVITRVVGTPDLKISWTEGDQPGQVLPGTAPDLYMASGSGTGQFQNSYDNKVWIKVDSGTLDLAGHKYISKNQFGMGASELYFKGLVAGQIPDASHPNGQGPYFSQAPAVGKMNVAISAAPLWNLVSIPFALPKNSSVDGAFFNQLREDGAYFYAFDDGIQAMSKLSFSANQWALEGPAYSVKAGSACWVWSPSAKTVTVMGAVVDSNFTRPLYSGFNLVGYPFPNHIATFNGAGLSATAGHAAYWFDNSTQATLKLEPLNNTWADASGKGIFGLNPKNGYWYYNAGQKIDWSIQKP